MSIEERLKAASTFLAQSPPGEVNDCFNDIRTIVADDEALESGIVPALQKYNEEQFVVVHLDGKNVLITEAAKLPAREHDNGVERYLDPRSQVSFVVNHITATTESPLPHPVDAETETLRSGIESVLLPYVQNHYNDGASAVYALPDANYPPEPEVEAVTEASSEEEPKPEADVEKVESESDAKVEDADDNAEAKVESEEVAAVPDITATENAPAEEDTVAAAEAATDTPAAEPIAIDTPTPTPAEAEVTAGDDVEPTAAALATDEADKVVETEIVAQNEPEVEAPPAPRPFQAVKSRVFGLYLVGNKYNPTNFWTGRWRSTYVADFEKQTLEGTVLINIHYYEQGNVQLSTTFRSSSPLPSANPSGTDIVALVKKSEAAAQAQLAEASAQLSDESFRGLRRALPKTRSKLDWGKISAYRLGSELGGAVTQEV